MGPEAVRIKISKYLDTRFYLYQEQISTTISNLTKLSREKKIPKAEIRRVISESTRRMLTQFDYPEDWKGEISSDEIAAIFAKKSETFIRQVTRLLNVHLG